MSFDVNKISIVHWYADSDKHRCGYCKNENSSISNGMWAEQLTVDDYQNLIDRGWRRSGKYCYKPIMDETCCPQYTIRCNALDFKTSKSQKKLIKKFNKFLNDGLCPKESRSDSSYCNETTSDVHIRDKPEFMADLISTTSLNNCDNVKSSGVSRETTNLPATLLSTSSRDMPKEKKTFKKGLGPDSNKPSSKKAKLLRLEKKEQKTSLKGSKTPESDAKTLEQFLNEIPGSAKHKLRTVLVRTSSLNSEWNKTKQIEYEIYRKYQMTVHNDPPNKCTEAGFTRFLVSSPFKMKVVEPKSDFKTTAKLYEKYQMSIHNEASDECNEEQFTNFLVETPLTSVQFSDGDSEICYGSYHQQYWIDDKLIAVGVIDILPKCVSSVYFFYDPDYRFLTLGTYSSLREIQFVRELHAKKPSIEHYYMGFYIHTCTKMRYKGNLNLSFLMCPETYQWFPIEQCRLKLDVNKYSRLNGDIDALDSNLCSSSDVDRIKIVTRYGVMPYGSYKCRFEDDEDFTSVANLIGKKSIETLVFVRS